MSVGGLIGAAAGGVIGFFIGGPAGAFYGASLGFALGMAIDPITPDMPSAGAPDQGDLVMSGEVGTLIADLAGTAKIAGHLLCYGGERAEPVYGKTSGGGGKGGGPPEPKPQITGYKYYMSWAVGLIAGQAGTLYAVYKNDEIVWEGELDCPASGGEETITLDGMGSATFYFGTDDHALNSKVGALLDDPNLNIPYRNLCWCFLDDCCIGEYNRAPTMKFVVKKIPEYSFSTKHEIQTYDCNPAHAKWFILHALTGLPESWLHSADFATAAKTLWVEDKGLSILFDRQQSALNYLENINAHIDSILRYGTDGKFHPKLIRDDYVLEDLPVIDEDVMLDEPTFDRKSWIDTLNEVKVQYSDLNVERPVTQGFVCSAGEDDGKGYLGRGGAGVNKTFLLADTSVRFADIGCFSEFSVGLTRVGELYVCGKNDGRNGDGTTANELKFKLIGSDKWLMVSPGQDQVMGLREDHSLWGTGDNHSGQLGLGHKNAVITYSREALNKLWDYVDSRSNASTLAIEAVSGILFGAGCNVGSQLSQGDWAPSTYVLLTQVKKHKDGGGYELDDSSWKQVMNGKTCVFAIKSNGTLWAVGNNGAGERLGLGFAGGVKTIFEQIGSDIWESVSSEEGGHSAAIKHDGSLWGWGKNDNGELGLGDTNSRNVPTLINDGSWLKVSMQSKHLLALKNDYTIWGAGKNYYYELGLNHSNPVHTLTKLNVSNWICIAGGDSCSMAILKS